MIIEILVINLDLGGEKRENKIKKVEIINLIKRERRGEKGGEREKKKEKVKKKEREREK